MKKRIFYSALSAVTWIGITSGTAYSGIPNLPPINVPTLGEWGMIGTALLLGIAGLYRILKSK